MSRVRDRACSLILGATGLGHRRVMTFPVMSPAVSETK